MDIPSIFFVTTQPWSATCSKRGSVNSLIAGMTLKFSSRLNSVRHFGLYMISMTYLLSVRVDLVILVRGSQGPHVARRNFRALTHGRLRVHVPLNFRHIGPQVSDIAK